MTIILKQNPKVKIKQDLALNRFKSVDCLNAKTNSNEAHSQIIQTHHK